MRCFTGPASSPRESSSLAVTVKVSLPPFFTNCRAKGSAQHSGFPYFAELSGSAVSSDVTAFDVHPSPNSDIPSCRIDSLLLKTERKVLSIRENVESFYLTSPPGEDEEMSIAMQKVGEMQEVIQSCLQEATAF